MSDAAPFDELVDRATRGDQPALETLMPLVYAELRRLAAHYLKGERPGQTLQVCCQSAGDLGAAEYG